MQIELKSFCHFLNLSFIFKPSNRMRNAFCFKDIIPTSMNSKVVCKLNCSMCSDVYIGETKPYLLVRQHEDLGKSILTEKPSKYNDKDATVIRKYFH